MITVSNQTSKTIEVAINQWATDGKTNFFTIKPQQNESWGRGNENGFVMAIKIDNETSRYYVKAESAIVVYDKKVTDHNKDIFPVG
ncbi:hypothetical protein [uncultured Tenacibaculum sp.]|uniref:hypothetical protein n=1 Tax=uncultured Tenacibaculum sp. TaxID=174713 RepID=UPI00261D3F65|nr:hypothetical protein [uncultured Tenacibaculum sp.]